MKILFINDSITEQAIFTHVIRDSFDPCELFQASSSDDAMVLMNQHEIDLVIQDIIRPGMDGFAFLKWLRKHPEWSRLPVVLHTLLSEDQCYEALQLANVWYLRSPLNKDELTHLLNHEIGLN